MNSLESFAKFIPAANNSLIIASASTSILTDSESKARRFTSSLNESLYDLANEPSIGFYRIQEHIRKSIPLNIEKCTESEVFRNKIQGYSFDLDYSHDAISRMARADNTLDSISRLLTDSLYAARQLNIRSKALETQISPKSLLSRARKQNKTMIDLDQKTSPKQSKTSSMLSSVTFNDNSNQKLEATTSSSSQSAESIEPINETTKNYSI